MEDLPILEILPSEPKRKKYKCDSCNHSTDYRSNILKHKEIHSSDREQYKCDFEGCIYKAMRSGDLRKHQQKHSDKEYKCDICNFILKSPTELHQHKKTFNWY